MMGVKTNSKVNVNYNFKSDLSQWNTENVKYMNNMFSGATKFNSDLSNWKIGNVTDMAQMFSGCENEVIFKFRVMNILNGWYYVKITTY